jgi:hypothetical protein
MTAELHTAFSWKRLAVAVLAWLFGCPLAGFIAACVDGEHGSIIFLYLGFAMGVSGAVAHATLLAFRAFESLRPLAQVTALWALAALVLAIFALGSAATSEGRTNAAEVLGNVAIYGLGPLLVAAMAINWLANRAVA